MAEGCDEKERLMTGRYDLTTHCTVLVLVSPQESSRYVSIPSKTAVLLRSSHCLVPCSSHHRQFLVNPSCGYLIPAIPKLLRAKHLDDGFFCLQWISVQKIQHEEGLKFWLTCKFNGMPRGSRNRLPLSFVFFPARYFGETLRNAWKVPYHFGGSTGVWLQLVWICTPSWGLMRPIPRWCFQGWRSSWPAEDREPTCCCLGCSFQKE